MSKQTIADWKSDDKNKITKLPFSQEHADQMKSGVKPIKLQLNAQKYAMYSRAARIMAKSKHFKFPPPRAS